LAFRITLGRPNSSHATIAVVVEQFKSVVGVFGSPDAEPANKQQFIDHAKIKRRISLKTLAKVLGTALYKY
jgi:hypothetical protein